MAHLGCPPLVSSAGSLPYAPLLAGPVDNLGAPDPSFWHSPHHATDVLGVVFHVCEKMCEARDFQDREFWVWALVCRFHASGIVWLGSLQGKIDCESGVYPSLLSGMRRRTFYSQVAMLFPPSAPSSPHPFGRAKGPADRSFTVKTLEENANHCPRVENNCKLTSNP